MISLFQRLVSELRTGKPSPNTCTSAGSGRGLAQMTLYPVLRCEKLLDIEDILLTIYQLTWLSFFECLVSKFRIGKPSPNPCTSAGSDHGLAQMILCPIMGCEKLLDIENILLTINLHG